MKLKVLLVLSIFVGSYSISIAAPDKVPAFDRIAFNFDNPNSPAYKNLMRQIDSLYDVEEAKGFYGSVLIGYKGKIIYERYIGYSDMANKIKWSPQTISQLASTSKPLTSAAILILADKGLVNLDAPVTKYLPTFPYENISVRMLLCHRSGLKDYIDFATAKPGKKYLDNDDILELFATQKPSLRFTPNTSFKYCNTNYALLASVVESVSGMKFKYFMERFVFKKLGMNQTIIHDPNLESPSYKAKSYKGGRHYEDMSHDGVYGAYGVYSSVRDMYKWDQSLYSNQLLKWSTIQSAFKPNNNEKNSQRDYGLGWRMLFYPNGTKVVYHNGWWHGNNTCFYRFIKDNFSIIVLGNKYSMNIYKQPQKIFKLINPEEEVDFEMK
jgi:CubicO group peptidase (beta-lactamase class C family)